MGFNKWKAKASYAYYDAPLVKRLRDNLRQLREAEDAESVKTVLEVCSTTARLGFRQLNHLLRFALGPTLPALSMQDCTLKPILALRF